MLPCTEGMKTFETCRKQPGCHELPKHLDLDYSASLLLLEKTGVCWRLPKGLIQSLLEVTIHTASAGTWVMSAVSFQMPRHCSGQEWPLREENPPRITILTSWFQKVKGWVEKKPHQLTDQQHKNPFYLFSLLSCGLNCFDEYQTCICLSSLFMF